MSVITAKLATKALVAANVAIRVEHIYADFANKIIKIEYIF